MVDTKKLREDDVLVGVKEPNVEGRWEYRQIYLVVKPIVDPIGLVVS